MAIHVTKPLSELSPYIFGTTGLRETSVPFEERVAVARHAIDAGAWLHTSQTYGEALKVLKAAFDQDRSVVVPTIVKIGWHTVEQVRDIVVEQLTKMGNPSMAIGQLCAGEQLALDLSANAPSLQGLRDLKEEGLVGRYVLEVFPWGSGVAIDVIRNNHADGLIDGYIFYFNPLQRFAFNELWDILVEQNIPIIGMRTVCGGDVRQTQHNEKAPEYLRNRAAEVAPIFERSGAATWTEFAVRFALGIPQVCATVGSTLKKANLDQFVAAAKNPLPLPQDITDEILSLHRRWSAEHDAVVPAGSM